MASANLVLHNGGSLTTREELALLPEVEPTPTWQPVPHIKVLSAAYTALIDNGYTIKRETLGIARNGLRFFATLDLVAPLSADGTVTLAVGIRNSNDKTFPMGFVAGSRVFVCDNLSFNADLMIRRKHSKFGEANYHRAIGLAVQELYDFQREEARRIEVMNNVALTEAQADSLILRSAAEKKIIPMRLVGDVWEEYQNPHHDEFKPRTAWSLFNAYTAAFSELQVKNPNELARRTMKLSSYLTMAA